MTQKALKFIIKKLQQFTSVVTKFLAEEMIIIVKGFGSKVVASAIRAVTTSAIMRLSINVVGRAAVFLSKMLISALSVVGSILFIIMFIDIILTFFDPLNYNKILPKTVPHDIMANGEAALRKAMENVTADFTFDSLITTILDEKTITKIQVESFVDVINYLDALTVNSEGTFIDKGTKINLNGTQNDYLIAQNKAIAKLSHFNPNTFIEYNEIFLKRVKINEYLVKVSGIIGCCSISLILLKYHLLAVVMVLLFIVAITILKYETQYNGVSNLLDYLNLELL